MNFISKNTNLESTGILGKKLESKYETGAASSSTSFQIQMGINTKSVPAHLNRLSPPLASEQR